MAGHRECAARAETSLLVSSVLRSSRLRDPQRLWRTNSLVVRCRGSCGVHSLGVRVSGHRLVERRRRLPGSSQGTRLWNLCGIRCLAWRNGRGLLACPGKDGLRQDRDDRDRRFHSSIRMDVATRCQCPRCGARGRVRDRYSRCATTSASQPCARTTTRDGCGVGSCRGYAAGSFDQLNDLFAHTLAPFPQGGLGAAAPLSAGAPWSVAANLLSGLCVSGSAAPLRFASNSASAQILRVAQSPA